MRKNLLIVCVVLGAMSANGQNLSHVVANPIDLNYRFQPLDNDPARREAADPVAIWFKDAYYLFASKSGGYWRSEDLCEWRYIPCKTIPTLEDYAPTVMEYKDELYFTASCDDRKMRVFKNANPARDEWQEVDCRFEYSHHDPAFYKDDDGKVYLYWGCSDKDPIMGVEVAPDDGFVAKGEPVALITHQYKRNGWEVPGDNNDDDKPGWNEGPAVLKHNGKYYLQYAAPGTQFRTYADGYYVSDGPLGPFEYAEASPFSIKTGGFIGGAGHGDTFRDKYGNLWHVATMKVSVRHWFERRIGLFPVTISDKSGMYAHQEFADYPFEIPQKKVDENHKWTLSGYNLLSKGKTVRSSSSLEGYEAAKASDECVETWWSAASGNAGEWLMMDLGDKKTVRAVQVNFADHDFTLRAPHAPVVYRYTVEASSDGQNWSVVADESNSDKDSPHHLLNFKQPLKARFLRVTNSENLKEGKFSIYDLRVFGTGNGKVPSEVKNFIFKRDADKRSYVFSWDRQPDATGYILHWGTDPDNLTHSTTVFDNSYSARYFNAGSEYFFKVTAFNENGESK